MEGLNHDGASESCASQAPNSPMSHARPTRIEGSVDPVEGRRPRALRRSTFKDVQ
jgi:hypothetical protein